MRYVEGTSRNQIIMMDFENVVSEESDCRVIDAFCENIDTKAMGFVHAETKDYGRPAYYPKDLKGISKNLLPLICTTSSAVILYKNPLTYVSMAA